MGFIVKLIELCARLGAGCASCGGCYQPELPKELR
ncbi:MAG: cyclic lactone autoinducer peptide [Lachnospiraceae bacterium]|jgi:cyclic lactone autoinducer peptide|nr:cyclic lactone autoinducer peptide [Lachnospiraceae bacterium]